MKKLTKLFSMLLVVAMGATMVACDEPTSPPPTPDPEPTPGQTELSIKVEPIEAGEDYLTFKIISTGVDWLFYVAVAEDMINDVEVNLDFVLNAPNIVEVESDEPCVVTFDGRVANTKYYVYVAGMTDDEKHSILSECVEMTTTAVQYETTALPTPDYCNINLTALTTVDRYEVALSDEENSLYFTFNFYTEAGTNGAIPAGRYTVSNFTAAGVIDLASITLEVNGLPVVISEGTLNVELYNNGANIRLDGTFVLVSGDSATLEYDGAVIINGSGETAATTFTVVNNLSANEDMEGIEPGWHEIQFLPVENSSTMLNIQFNSDPAKSYITNGFYPVFDSQASAEAMSMGSSWISTVSFYQEGITPYSVVAGMDSYAQVTTNMDSGVDYYEITFSLKLRSLFDKSESVLNAVYRGPLGFVAQDVEEDNTLTMAQNYVDITSDGTTHTLDFHGSIPSLGMSVTIEGALPEVGGDYTWYNIVSGTFFDHVVALEDPTLGNAALLEGSRIAIKRFVDSADPADEGVVKPYYGFKLEAQVVGWDIVGEWTSYQHSR